MNLLKTQYLYVNSVNRNASDKACSFKLKIPPGIFLCDKQTQFFKLAIQDFSMGNNWYYVNATNNTFKINAGVSTSYTVNIPQGNYNFKQLAAIVQTSIQTTVGSAFSVTVTWDGTLNKLVFKFPLDVNVYGVDFNVSNSAYGVLGFNTPSVYSPDLIMTGLLISDKPLSTTLSKNICISMPNLSPLKESTNVYNANDEVCVPARFLLSIPNNFAPFDIISFVNQNDLFSMYIKEKQLTDIEFNVTDENGVVLEYITDWRASIKVETLEYKTDADTTVNALHEIRDTLKLQLLSNALNVNKTSMM